MEFSKVYRIKRRDIKIQCTVQIPKAVMRHLGLRIGDELVLTVDDGNGRARVVLEPRRAGK